MILVTLAAALVLAAPPAAPARTPAAKSPPPRTTPDAVAPSIETPKIPFQRFVLPNGLVLIVHEDPKAPIVAVNVWYHVGSKNERPGKTGFAHLFEHLMFNGSEHFNDDWFKVLERIGGTDLNGTTNRDRTNYFQNVPTPALDTVLWMESDRMGHLLGAVTQARLDEQRGVVKNEKRQGENQPYGRAWEAISAGSFPAGHPYSWTTIGSMQDLDAATLDDVKAWFKDWYGAANAVIVVAGDVKADDVRSRVEKYFGNIPSGPPLTRQEAWIAKRTGEHRQAMADRVPQSRVYLVWNTPSWTSPESDDLNLAARILSSGKSSRLYKRLVYDGQIATDTAAMQASGEIAGQFMITATARPGGELAPVEAAAREELARFLEKGPTQAELDRARMELLASFTRGVERIGGFGGKSDVLAQGEVFGGRPDFYEERLARVRSATPARVQAAAQRWLTDGVFVLEVTPWKDGKVSASDADRSKVPDAGTPPAPRFPEVEKAVLGNGLRVMVVSRPSVPVVNFQLVVDAGFSSDPKGAAGTARLAAALIPDGTATRNALQISDALRDLGATLSASSSLDGTTVALSALKSRLDPSLELFADVALHPSFPEAELERQKKLLLAAIEREKAEPGSMAGRVLPRLVYGEGHPYANPSSGSGTKASVSALTRADVERWYRSRFHPSDACPRRGGRRHHEGDPAPAGAALLLLGAREGDDEGPRPGQQGGRTAPLPRRQARIGAVGHPGRHARPAARQPRGDRAGGGQPGAGRRLHVPHQHEPARGQALDLRGAHRPRRRQGSPSLLRLGARPVGQDQGVGAGDPEGARRHRRRPPGDGRRARGGEVVDGARPARTLGDRQRRGRVGGGGRHLRPRRRLLGRLRRQGGGAHPGAGRGGREVHPDRRGGLGGRGRPVQDREGTLRAGARGARPPRRRRKPGEVARRGAGVTRHGARREARRRGRPVGRGRPGPPPPSSPPAGRSRGRPRAAAR